MAVFSRLKQFKELRSKAKQIQEKLSQETIHVEGAKGKIHLIMDGNQKVLSLDIDPELLDPQNKKSLEEDLKKLYNEAIKKVQRIMAQKVQKGEIELPKL